MAFWQPIHNLKEYVAQNPPPVTFFLCLLTMSVSFISLGSYSETHTLPNPDVIKDWNHVLSTLSTFHLCVNSNVSSDKLKPATASHPSKKEAQEVMSFNSTKPSLVSSLHLKVPLSVRTDSVSGFKPDEFLHTTLKASQLKLGGNETVFVTLYRLSENDTSCCLTISAPTHILPMSLVPPECPVSYSNYSLIRVEARQSFPAATTRTCYSLTSRNDPSLTVMLTQAEQHVAVRHLLEVSVCLLGLCLILCFAASLAKSLMGGGQWKTVDTHNEPLI
ncbi:transmembrane protein 248 [Synchiropus picturatus]